MSDYIKVFLCDGHTLFREGIKRILEAERDIRVVGTSGDAGDMLRLLKKVYPDIILLNIGIPGGGGISAASKAKKALPFSNVIILTNHEDKFHIVEAIKAGVMGYLLKNVSVSELLDAVRRVYRGEALIQPLLAAKVLKEFALLDKKRIRVKDKLSGLTKREKDILRLIVLGGTNKEIAARLAIAEKTVKNHISRIFQTLHVNNRTKAALYALDRMK